MSWWLSSFQNTSIYFYINLIDIHMMKVMIAGGDGFIGWPLSMRLSNLGYDVLIVDNFYRRKIDEDNGFSSISPIKPL